MFEALPAGRPLPGLYWRGRSQALPPYLHGDGDGLSGGLERRSGNSVQNWDAWLVETSRRTPQCATLSRNIYKMRNQNMTRVAVNTILGKGDKSFLAY